MQQMRRQQQQQQSSPLAHQVGGSSVEKAVRSCDAYKPEYVQRIVRDINDIQGAASLEAKAAEHFSDFGERNLLVELEGTVPINYQSNRYNIPMRIWISKSYPESAPLVYVTPKPGMHIVDGHKHVNRDDGLVSHHYLQGWQASRSNLSGLLNACKTMFSIAPPSEQNRTRQALEIKLQEKFKKFREQMKTELSDEMKIQTKLEEGQRVLEEGLGKLGKQKDDLEATIHELDLKETQLKTWLEQYGNADEEGNPNSCAIAQINLDEAIVPADGLSRQLFDCVAETSAIDDTLYHLDRALSNDIIKLPDFLKEVRKLARKQFMAKALALKIQEHQQKMHMQTRQVPSLNSRPPPYRPS
ncbi:Ubiquitin-conjugating enzyme E2 variant 3 [Hondaea fermentalgiana]|uniref:Ubiquitin-conjugating enzyme E2 variant 3 n=1 Tax=Hondaea fermentalgiana TaxID=2315210 RepID=A0A2R5G7T7_9STRA|nr:Ubiquitin-conjugating enzyme E2 variant 3 [Hondaea fermentalgiana]|eukprot:GBG27112.1 Ubiquitin-conjugating enzyme E2 variant 3 [Hondaea fermentalgiana]